MACPHCSSLVIAYSKVIDHCIKLPLELDDVYPGLFRLTQNADSGCDPCRLLIELVSKSFNAVERGQ